MKHEEDDLQMAVCNHLRARAVPGLVWFHPANGGRRNVREAGRFKAMGVTAGVSDLILFHNKQFFALELKAAKGRLSPAQKEFLRVFEAAGGYAGVAYGIDDALWVLHAWGFIR